MSTTTGIDTSTIADDIWNVYLPPITLIYDKDGNVRYKPVYFEKDLVQYDLSLIQMRYTDKSLGPLYVHVKVDGSKNVINNRFEILDL